MFNDLEDRSEWDGSKPTKPQTTNPHVEDISNVEIPMFTEKCPKCRGTGRFTSYSGRTVGECFKCKGKGELTFKTSPTARAKARQSAAKRQVKKLEDALAALPEDVREWLVANQAKGNDFAESLGGALAKYGRLTENQIAAVRKGIARDEDAAHRTAEWAENHADEHAWLVREVEAGNEFAGSLLDALNRYGSLTEGQLAAVRRNLEKDAPLADSDLDISSLKGYYAVPGGDTRLKLCVRKPGKNSRWYGWTFVDDGAAYGNRTTYGKQAPDGTYKGRLADELAQILANPLEAQKAYGHLTGTCGRCGRILEDEESVRNGIGPVCAEKAMGG